jgi:integrase/recombinase XerD
MATLRKSPNSKNWIACFRDLNGKQHNRSTKIPDTGTAKERADARRRAKEIADSFERVARGELRRESELRQAMREIAALATGAKVDPQTVSEFYDTWLESLAFEDKPESTRTKYSGIVKGFLAHLGDRAGAPFDSLEAQDFESFRLHCRSTGKSPGTTSSYLKILRFAYARAVTLGMIARDPSSGVKEKPGKKHAKRAFSVEQIRRLFQFTGVADYPEEWKTLMMVCAFCGFSQTDAARLRWKQIDFTEDQIVSDRTKTGVAVSTVLPPQLKDHLLSLPSADDPEAYLLPTLSGQKPQQRSMTFARIMDAAGIDAIRSERKEGGRSVAGLSLHSLRHAFATHLQAAGVAAETVAKGMGHTNTKQTAAYSHGEKEQILKAFEGITI